MSCEGKIRCGDIENAHFHITKPKLFFQLVQQSLEKFEKVEAIGLCIRLRRLISGFSDGKSSCKNEKMRGSLSTIGVNWASKCLETTIILRTD